MRVFYLVIGSAILILALELGAKLYGDVGLTRITIDDNLGWRFLPNSYWDNHWGKRANFNSEGFRDKNRVEKKADGVKRVLLLGDSYTAGAQVADDEIFAHQLEEKLNQKSQQEYEVINIAVPAWATGQQLLYFAQEGAKWEADIVFLIVAPNDLRESFAKKLVTVENGQIVKNKYHFTPTEKFLSTLSHYSYLYQYFQKEITHTNYGHFHFLFGRIPMTFKLEDNEDCEDIDLFAPEKSKIVRDSYSYFESLLKQFEVIAKKRGSKFFVSVIPTLIEFESKDGAHEQNFKKVATNIEEISANNEIQFVDLFENFSSYKNPRLLFLKDEFHLSVKGHGSVANALSKFILNI